MKKKFLCIGVLSLSLMACASNPVANTTANQPPTSNPSDAVNISNSTDDSANINNNANADQATNSVYFGVDQYNVDNQYDSVVGYNANYLASHNGASVKVAGNTDDSDSVEYNLALGQRRADAVKKALIAKGANMNQIEAVSNGKLIAKFSNASDDGRAKNRRTDIIFTKQQPAGYHLDANGLPVVK